MELTIGIFIITILVVILLFIKIKALDIDITEAFVEIESCVKKWLIKEASYKVGNLPTLIDIFDKIDVKTALLSKRNDSDIPIVFEKLRNISTYSNGISRLLDLELYLRIIYGDTIINEIKKRVLNTLFLFNKQYDDDIYLSKKNWKTYKKEYEIVWLFIFVQNIYTLSN